MLSKLNLRKRMFIFIIGANLIVLLGIFFIYLNFFRNLLVKETKSKAQIKVNKVAVELQGTLNEKAKVGWTFTKQPLIKQWLKENTIRDYALLRKTDQTYRVIIDFLKEIAEKDPLILAAFIASEKSQMYYENLERSIPDDYIVGTRPWYVETVKEKKAMFEVSTDFVTKEIFVTYRCPIPDEQGDILGVGGIDISLEKFTELVSTLSDVFSTGQAFIIAKDGTFLYHPNTSYVLEKKITDFTDDGTQYKYMNEVSQQLIEEKEGIEEVVFEGEKRYFIHTQIPSLGWTVVLSAAVSEINKPIRTLIVFSLIVIVVASLIFIVIINYLVHSISDPLNNLVSMLKSIAKGEADLTKRLEVTSKDEIGELANWFNDFVETLHDLIVNVRDNVYEIVKASDNLKDTTVMMDKGAEDQSNTTSNIASSTREMSTTINETSRIYNQAVEVVKKATVRAQDGDTIVKRSAEGMKRIADSVEKSQMTISELSSRSNEIGKIIQVIDEIAEQTNLLALNARIEAAGAGEEGKGFAVVAEDISKLAERTSEATREISKIIKAIQNDMSRVVESMEEGINDVENGTGLVKDSGNVLSEIMLNVEEIQRVISELSQASEQMTLASEEISKNTKSVDDVTSENVKSTKNLSVIASQMKEKADALNNKISRFKL